MRKKINLSSSRAAESFNQGKITQRMKDAPLFYREEMPTVKTAHFIFSFWEFRVEAEKAEPIMHELFPDGCISLVFYRNKLIRQERLFTNQINPKSIYVPVAAGDTYWGMRILPEACFAFFGKSSSEIGNRLFEEQHFEKRFSAQLERRMSECETFSDAIEAFESYVESVGVKVDQIDSRLAKATRIFIETEGLAKVSETAKAIGLSERQFERNYLKASGLTPKQFASICRLRATALDMLKNSNSNWADRAAEKGFTDQSHLNREFSRLTGNSPVEFSENVKRIRHGKIVE